MKINYRKIFISATILFVIGLFAYSFAFFPTGYVGTTRKGQVNLGCVCHADTANSIVNVQIIGPDSIPVNTTAFYRVKVNGGPAILGGFNIANNNDTVSLTGVPNDTMVRKQDGELTHTHPKPYNAGIQHAQLRVGIHCMQHPTAPMAMDTQTVIYGTGA